MRNSVGMRLSSLIPRPVQKIGEKGLVSTVVHVLNLIPSILEFWILLHSIIIPGSRIFNRTLLTIAISVRDLNSAMLYAFMQH